MGGFDSRVKLNRKCVAGGLPWGQAVSRLTLWLSTPCTVRPDNSCSRDVNPSSDLWTIDPHARTEGVTLVSAAHRRTLGCFSISASPLVRVPALQLHAAWLSVTNGSKH